MSSRLIVNSIRHTGASGDAVTLANDGTCTAKITNNLSNRNLIINGAMLVAQRSASSTSGGYQTVDRFNSSYANTGNTVVVIEHNLDVIKTADHIVDMGPEGGVDGGKIIAEGSPEKVAEISESYTGRFIRDLLGNSSMKKTA